MTGKEFAKHMKAVRQMEKEQRRQEREDRKRIFRAMDKLERDLSCAARNS